MPAKVNIQAIVTFLLISFTLAWLLTLLLANSDWLHNPWFAPLMCLMVCSPGIAALTTMGIVAVCHPHSPIARVRVFGVGVAAEILGLPHYCPGKFYGFCVWVTLSRGHLWASRCDR